MIGSTIALREIKKIYKVGPIFVEVIKNVDFAVEEGMKALLHGGDRPGRGALMRILGLIEQPTAGEVFMDNENLTDITYDEMCARRNAAIGYVSDMLPLAPRKSVLENVKLPLKIRGGLSRADITAMAMDSLTYVGAEDLASTQASKLDEEWRRKVALARAIVGRPSLLWVDDSWLSKKGRAQAAFMENVERICGEVGLTLVVSAANPMDGIIFDQAVRLKDGRVDISAD